MITKALYALTVVLFIGPHNVVLFIGSHNLMTFMLLYLKYLRNIHLKISKKRKFIPKGAILHLVGSK